MPTTNTGKCCVVTEGAYSLVPSKCWDSASFVKEIEPSVHLCAVCKPFVVTYQGAKRISFHSDFTVLPELDTI